MMTFFICTALVAVLVPILAMARHRVRRERKRIKTWRFVRVE